jgi:hypothetical protein
VVVKQVADMSCAESNAANPQELADLATEAIDAVMETQNRYARDWSCSLHGQAWEAARKARAQ